MTTEEALEVFAVVLQHSGTKPVSSHTLGDVQAAIRVLHPTLDREELSVTSYPTNYTGYKVQR